MGRMTPTQQSHLIDIANDTIGITELVLLTTVVDDRGVKLAEDDIMYENNLANPTMVPAIDSNVASNANPNVNNTVTPNATSTATPIVITEEGESVNQPSSSPYIDLYQGQ